MDGRLYQTYQQRQKQMYKYRDKYVFGRKDFLKADKEPTSYSRLNYYSTLEPKCEEDNDYTNTVMQKKIDTEMTESSRIADQGEPPTNDYQSFQASILRKVQCIQEQSNKLLEKKERELYFLRIQLTSTQQRLRETEQQLVTKDKRLSFLENQMRNLKIGTEKFDYTSKNYEVRELQKENEKLKESLRILVEQKNLHWKNLNTTSTLENFNYNKINVSKMKQQIQQLRLMVMEMQQTVKNCPKCFALKREKEELSIAYNCLVKQHSQLNTVKSSKEKQLLENITNKIKENQNILRENMKLKQDSLGRPYFKSKGQRLKDSVAKRCRTLTDQF